MIGLSAKDEKTVVEIILAEAPDCQVFAFGSRFLGTNRDSSDLDLAFALPDGAKLPLKRIGEIKYAFSESDLVFRVDVLDYNGIEQRFRQIIDANCQKIYP